MQYEGGGADTPATDIICPMYARTHQDQPFPAVPKWALAKWIGLPEETRPLILCEYAHAMGNSLGLCPLLAGISRSSAAAGWVCLGLGRSGAGQTDRRWPPFLGLWWRFRRHSQRSPVLLQRPAVPRSHPHPSLFEARRAQQPFVLTPAGSPAADGGDPQRIPVPRDG